jgi:endonuclease/exonuclease/phosphatase family metal-dependent hydrolase
MSKRTVYRFLVFCLFVVNMVSAQDTVRIMAYNILNFDISDTSRHPFYRTVIQNSNPDILVVEEILSQNAVNNLRDRVLNTLGIGSFSAGTFINGFDSDNAIFFKSSKFIFISNTPIHTELRDINEFKVVHIATSDTLRLYAVHLKANNTSADQQQRAREVDSLRKVTNALPLSSNFIVLGDFNIYGANEPAYQKLLQVISGNEGHFIDMLNLPGSWNNSTYAIYHTQSPRVRAFGGGSTGGMDDRFDMILYSKAVSDPGIITIIQQSLKSYGNDGNHFNDSINRPPNQAVGQFIADALHYGSDHLPILALFKFENPIGILPITNEIPNGFKLYQNYPNPFNPSTKIKFEIPLLRGLPAEVSAQAGVDAKGGRGVFVSLKIYDILGRQIASLVNEKLSPGTYEVIFDATKYSSGMYFYRITAGDYIETKRMILVK